MKTAPPELCHVTIQGPRRRADVALPATVPILEFTPLVAVLCEAADPRSGQDAAAAFEATPPAWTLARAGAPPLDLATSLADAGVLNGEVLHLVDASDWRPPVVSDLADAVTGALEGGGRGWAAEAGLAALGGAFLVVTAGAAAASGLGNPLTGVLALLAAAGMAVSALAWPPARTWPATRLALAAGSVALAALAGWSLAGAPGGAAGVAVAVGTAVIALLPACAAVPALAPGGALVAAAVAAGAAAVAAGAAPAQAAAVAAAAGVIALRLLPRLVSRAFAGLRQRTDPAAVEAGARSSRLLLDSLSGGTAAVVLGAAVTLLAGRTGFGAGLAAAGAAALLLRAQGYRFAPEALPPAVSGGVAVLALGLAFASALAAGGRVGLAVGVLGAAGLALTLASARRAAPPFPPFVARWAWLAVDLSLGPLLLGQLGVYDAAAGLVHHVFGH